MDDVIRFFSDGDVWMLPIAFVSFLALAIGAERVVQVVFRLDVDGPRFMDQIKRLVAAGEIPTAIGLCDAAGAAVLPRVARAGLLRADAGEQAIRDAIDEAVVEAVPRVTKRTTTLATLASLATLLGLLGTVMGLIHAFRAVGEAAPHEKAAILTKSISLAMNCTAFGLMVGIPALFVHLVVGGAAKKIIDDVDVQSLKLENLLVARARGERGA